MASGRRIYHRSLAAVNPSGRCGFRSPPLVVPEGFLPGALETMLPGHRVQKGPGHGLVLVLASSEQLVHLGEVLEQRVLAGARNEAIAADHVLVSHRNPRGPRAGEVSNVLAFGLVDTPMSIRQTASAASSNSSRRPMIHSVSNEPTKVAARPED